jgi:Leucine-rich repeat (LRR) protein
LAILYCNNNNLNSLPKNLSKDLVFFDYNNNKYLHIPYRYARDYEIKETPDYNKKANTIQKSWKKTKILNIMKLLTCHKIFDIPDLHKIMVFYL